MSTDEKSRRRTEPEDDGLSDDDVDSNIRDTENPEAEYRSRVREYNQKNAWPMEPAYAVNEVVWLPVEGQQNPDGPYVVVSYHTENDAYLYVIKKQADGVYHPYSVREADLRVRVEPPRRRRR